MRVTLSIFLLSALTALGVPFIVTEGDSLTAGTGASPTTSSNWPAQMQLLYPWTVQTNVSHAGDLLADTTIQDATNQLAAAITAGRSPRTVTLLMGINDIASGTTVAATYGYFSNWVKGVKAFDPSANVVGATLFAANQSFESRRLEYNAMIRTNADLAMVVDLAADSRLTNYANTTYFDADGVHLNNTGYNVVASLFGTAIRNAGYLTTTLYVRTDGSDSNVGTSDNAGGALLTVQAAANKAKAGDAVTIRSGTYAEDVTATNLGLSSSPIVFTGESGVTIGGVKLARSYQQLRNVALNGTNVPSNEAFLMFTGAAVGCVASNIAITGSTGGTNSGPGGVTMGSGADAPSSIYMDAIRIVNPTQHAFTLTGTGHTVTNCFVTGTTGWDCFRIVASNLRIVNNVVTNFTNIDDLNSNHADIFQSFGDSSDVATNVLIEANIVANCTGYQLGNITDDQELGEIGNWTWRNNVFANITSTINLFAPNFSFYNNTFYRAGTTSNWAIVFNDTASGHADNLTIKNNLFVDCAGDGSSSKGWYGGDATVTNLVADYNLVVGATGGTVKTGFTETHGVNGDMPDFASAAELNFRLLTGSAGVGAGADLSASFADDITGATRSAPWDIGAYEFDGSEPPPPPTPYATAVSATVGTLLVQ